jgi:hypothetical protein
MLNPFDGWTLVHAAVGFSLGRIKVSRWLFYPVVVGWEVYQLYFHYLPKGYNPEYVWLNSLVDILSCSTGYEFAPKLTLTYITHRLRFRMNSKTKWIIAYVLLTSGIAWVLWDDAIRRGLLAPAPLAHIPLVLGSRSPAVASFVVRTWSNGAGFTNAGFSLISQKQWSYYLIAGFLPSAVILIVILLVF